MAIKRHHWPIITALVLLLILGLLLIPLPTDDHDPLRGMGGDFTLSSTRGDVSLRDFKGKIVAIYFGYTACPDICPTSLSALAGALRQLTPEELQQIQGLFISVDPERDTPEKAAEYGRYFHTNILGVTGELENLRDIADRYGAYFRKATLDGSTMGYAVDHSSTIFLVDRKGKLRDVIQHSGSSQVITQHLERALAQ